MLSRPPSIVSPAEPVTVSGPKLGSSVIVPLRPLLKVMVSPLLPALQSEEVWASPLAFWIASRSEHSLSLGVVSSFVVFTTMGAPPVALCAWAGKAGQRSSASRGRSPKSFVRPFSMRLISAPSSYKGGADHPRLTPACSLDNASKERRRQDLGGEASHRNSDRAQILWF